MFVLDIWTHILVNILNIDICYVDKFPLIIRKKYYGEKSMGSVMILKEGK